MSYFAMEQGLCKHGINVPMTVWQLRCDKFVVFFSRDVYILNLSFPGVTKDLSHTGYDLSTISRDSFLAVANAGNYAREVKAADMKNLQFVID